jgi:hypothetical protein
MTTAKPVILWTCDVEGWAYHNRIQRLAPLLPQYEHRILYFGKGSRAEQAAEINAADVIVCQGIKSIRVVRRKELRITDLRHLEQARDAAYDNVVVRIDSMRIDRNGEYIDLWT